MIPLSDIESLAAHLAEGKALCRHDLGWRLPEVLRQLLQNQRVEEITLETLAEEFHVKHFGEAKCAQ